MNSSYEILYGVAISRFSDFYQKKTNIHNIKCWTPSNTEFIAIDIAYIQTYTLF